MDIRLSTIIISLLLSTACFARTELDDSIAGRHMLPSDTLSDVRLDSASRSIQALLLSRGPALGLTGYQADNPFDVDIPAVAFTPGHAQLFTWHGCTLVATGSTNLYPGLMKVDSGSLVATRQAGRFTISLGASATKYGYFRGVHTQYGVSGSLSYLIFPRLSFTVFGNYYFGRPPVMDGGLPLPPSMAEVYKASTFGGYFDYEINDRFGVQVGAQSVRRIGTNSYRTEPIVTPYVKVGNVGIGLPVGQIIYGIIQSEIDRKHAQYPPMPQPQMRQPRLKKAGH